ncbi:hypothetical protein [Phenylobacterium montanum]|uniref:Uncharacterized protein n=1 Tax=Phenylobacterium montanum TaxID=2823693 RepID=A0A975G2P3_9CAUL|nr:hypothetical protein [Caulobacter sp. S6]QUD90028.1 hypothetical protein KCG34_09270 [Caulobacter sp. S6]
MMAFDGWQGFYQVTAEAAATLTGLLFIVVTLTAGRQTAATNNGARLFTSPTVFHLASVLAVSALALVPREEGTAPGLVMTAWSAWGFIYTAAVAVKMARLENTSHWSDFWWYGFGPAATFAALAAASVACLLGYAHAAFGLSLGLLAALMVAIRNAWDLATWLAVRRD